MYSTDVQINLGVSVGNTLLIESTVPKDPKFSRMLKDPKIARLVSISKSYFKSNEKLDQKEQKEADELFKDPKVKRYLNAATKVGQRIGWIRGGMAGVTPGFLIGGIAGISTGTLSGILAVALLGAIIGGLSIGYLASRVMGVLKRWEAEEELASGKNVRVHT